MKNSGYSVQTRNTGSYKVLLPAMLGVSLMFCAPLGASAKKHKDVHELASSKGEPALDSAETLTAPGANQMNEVVVTGQYSATSTEKSVQRIRIIDRQRIEAMGAQNLRDVMMNEMNIRLSQDNVLGSSMSIQGISGQNVKILIDGVAVIGRQDGNLDISQLMLSNIERIEIVEGPMSVNYGTDALAGTINLITKKTLKSKVEVGATAYTESTGNYNLSARGGYSEGRQTVIVNGSRNLFDGWNEGEQNTFFNFSPRAADQYRTFQWKPKVQYNAGLQYIYKLGKTTLNYKGDYFRETIINRGAPDYYGENASDDYYRTYRVDNAVFANSMIGKNNLNVQVAYNQFKRVKNTYAKDLTTLGEELSTATGAQDTSLFNAFSSRATFSSGNAKQKLNYELGYDINLETGTGIRIKSNKQQIGDYALFASAEYKPIDNLTIRPGLRYAYNTGYKAPLIPSLNIRYKYNDFTLRASYAKGFRAPTLKELYFDFHDSNHDIDGNENLVSEYSSNYNGAVAYARMREQVGIKVEVNAFYNDIRNRIDLATINGSTYTYVNIGRFRTKGIQLNTELRYRALKVSAGAGYIGRYNSLSEYGNELPDFSYTPEVRGSVMYEFEKAGMSAAVFFKKTGSTPGLAIDATTENVVRTTNQGFTVADASVSKSFADKRFIITVGSKNIFNITRVNSTVSAAEGGAHSGNTGTTVSIPYSMGRTVFIKMDLNLHSAQ